MLDFRTISRNNTLRLIALVVGLFIIFFCIYKVQNPTKHKINLVSMFDDGNTRLNYEIKNFKVEIEQLTNIEINIINYQKLKADFPSEFNNSQALLKKVSEGSEYQMILGSAYYWIDSIPESVFFASMPFGMHQEALSNWIGNNGEGRLIWDSIYLKRSLNLKPFPFGQTGGQWGGISSVSITKKEDFKNVYFRMPGLGAKVLEKFGGIPFEKGKFNINTSKISEYATVNECKKFIEWIGVKEDKKLILEKWSFCPTQKSKKLYYYTNGWHERNTLFELLINRTFLNENLDEITRQRLYSLIDKYNYKILAYFPEMNELEYNKIRFLNGGKVGDTKVEFVTFPPSLIEEIRNTYENQVLPDFFSKSPSFKSIYGKYKNYMETNDEYYKITLRESNK